MKVRQVNFLYKIIDGELESDVVFEDELVLAIHDKFPQAPVHVLVFLKDKHKRNASVSTMETADIGVLIDRARRVAEKIGLRESGFRLIINDGADGGQSIAHVHCHLLGGERLARSVN